MISAYNGLFLYQIQVNDGVSILTTQSTPEEIQVMALYVACLGIIVYAWTYWQASKKEAQRERIRRMRHEQRARELAEFKRRNLIQSMKEPDF